MKIEEIGALIKKRKEQGFKQAEAAGFLNVGTRFLSELENGKPTTQIGKVIEVIEGFGYEMILVPKSERALLKRIKDILDE